MAGLIAGIELGKFRDFDAHQRIFIKNCVGERATKRNQFAALVVKNRVSALAWLINKHIISGAAVYRYDYERQAVKNRRW